MLPRFLPKFCSDAVFVELDEKVGVIEKPATKQTKAKIADLACWQMAWDRYALAVAMVERIPFFLAMQYKQARQLP